MSTVNLMLGDCLEKMGEIEDGTVDAVIADPPYGLTECDWDQAPDWTTWWFEAKRVCKPNAFVVLFTQMPAALDMIGPARKNFRYDLVAHKNTATGHLNANRCPLRNHELVFVFAFGKPVWNRHDWQRSATHKEIGRTITRNGCRSDVYGKQEDAGTYVYSETECPKSVFSMTRLGNFNSKLKLNHHPTAKPVESMNWLVESYSHEGSVVLDPWFGSGTTGVACVNTGRNFIGVERDETYFNVATDRIAKAQRQQAELLPLSAV